MNTMSDDEFERAALLNRLSVEAVECAPTMFALYRLREHDGDRAGAVGWGMDFGEGRGALFGYPYESTVWHSDSAEALLRRHGLLGDAYLRWLPAGGSRG